MEDRIQHLEKEVQAIKDRNFRVEADKAWEISGFRIGSIVVLTYFVAAGVLFLIGAENVWFGAFVPVVGYLLSTQSLPVLKRWWVERFVQGRERMR